ncbi:MAG: insulinase family protein [Clostridia bacterium]|nr:insulinase family protein [Clostridia bacterium]
MNRFQTGELLHGFRVTQVREMEELGGTLVSMVYEKTGTEAVFLDNGEENKTFAITFKTLPEDSTGVFHILEHSCLSGSDRYPVREPFVELLKTSVNTYLNAMTFQDKTMYPVSSRNAKDFLNLTGVYLDAVFHPRLLHDPNIFYQEGWHIEQDETGEYVYKGVVFNEMKGSMGQEMDVMRRAMRKLLFPDTCYGLVSGGDPREIPNLTYEQYRETYRKFYHPSNARIYLDGAVPLKETLELIDSYLRDFDALEGLKEDLYQTPVSGEVETEYEVAGEEETKNRATLTYGKIIGRWDDPLHLMACKVVTDVLLGSNEAPVTRKILESRLAEDVLAQFNDSLLQCFLTVSLQHMQDGAEEKAAALLMQALEEEISKGFDPEDVEATINEMEYYAREKYEPQGIDRAVAVMDSWLYGGDPAMYLVCDDRFRDLRALSKEEGKLESIAREIFLEEAGRCRVLVRPSVTLGARTREEEKQRILKTVQEWSEEEKQENARMNEQLLLWQRTGDTPEQLSTLPVLTLEDVGEMARDLECRECALEGARVLLYPLQGHGVSYVTMYFPLGGLTAEELFRLKMAATLLGAMPTARRSAYELGREVKKTIGSVAASLECQQSAGEYDTCRTYLKVSASMLDSQLTHGMELIAEMLLESVFDRNKVQQVLIQTETSVRQSLTVSGHNFAFLHVNAFTGSAGALSHELSGVPSLRRLSALRAGFEEQGDGLIQEMGDLLRRAVRREGMILALGCDAPEAEALTPFMKLLPRDNAGAPLDDLPRLYETTANRAAGYAVPSQVSYVARGWSQRAVFPGSMHVLSHIMGLTCLWGQVRVQGGAYGTGMTCSANGNLNVYSYRDPTPARTLKVFEEMDGWLKEYCLQDDTIEPMIIAAMSGMNPLLSARQKMDRALMRKLTGYTEEDRARIWNEMKKTTREDFQALIPYVRALGQDGPVCAVGYAAALEGMGLTVEEI